MPEHALHVPQHPVRLVTASSLFDGHDRSEEHTSELQSH